MSTPSDYTTIAQVHVNQWDNALQQAVPGWQITVRDNVTGTIVPVFIDDAHYTVQGARTLIEAALGPVRAIAQLGGTGKPASAAG